MNIIIDDKTQDREYPIRLNVHGYYYIVHLLSKFIEEDDLAMLIMNDIKKQKNELDLFFDRAFKLNKKEVK